jgi:hypothetical protein
MPRLSSVVIMTLSSLIQAPLVREKFNTRVRYIGCLRAFLHHAAIEFWDSRFQQVQRMSSTENIHKPF